MTTCRFSAVIEKDKDGYYAFCPEFHGCLTPDDTFEEALASIREAIALPIEDCQEVDG
jgi:predicted RNase H-like HicB family nuclease